MSEIKSKIGLTPKGAYSSSTTYDYLDYVTNADGTYTSKQANNVGHALTETDWWEHDFISPKMRVNATTKNWEVSYDGGTTYTDTGVSSKGTDAVSPQLKIDSTTFNWMLSTDGGATWTDLGVASKQVTSSASVVQETGTSITDVMSQKAITDVLVTKADHGYPSNPKTLKQVDDLKENSANKQNNLNVDGTGTKFPTVDAVNAGLAGKQPTLVSGTNIKTLNGQSLIGSGDVDSNLILEYTITGNKEVAVTSINLTTGIFTSVGHGFKNGDRVNPIINNINLMDIFPQNYFPGGLFPTIWTFFVVSVTIDTFGISMTDGGEPMTYSDNASMDLSKWHFETYNQTNLYAFSNLPAGLKDCKVVINGGAARYNFGHVNINGYAVDKTLKTTDKIYSSGSSIAINVNTISANAEIKIFTGKYITEFIGYTTSEMVSGQAAQINTTKYDSVRIQPIPTSLISSIEIRNFCLTNGSKIKIYR